jgi:hypothetical protein
MSQSYFGLWRHLMEHGGGLAASGSGKQALMIRLANKGTMGMTGTAA